MAISCKLPHYAYRFLMLYLKADKNSPHKYNRLTGLNKPCHVICTYISVRIFR